MVSINQQLIFKKFIAFSIIVPYVFILYNLPNTLFRDRQIYELFAENSNAIFAYETSSLSFYTNEPIFLKLASLFNEHPQIFPSFMGSIIGLVYCIYLEKFSKNFFVFILGFLLLVFNTFLIYPQVMQLRQGLATALFLVITLSVNKSRNKFILLSLLPFIHIIFFVIIPLYIYYEVYLKNKTKFIIVRNTFFISFIISLFAITLMYALGLRQAEQYDNVNFSGGGGSFLMHLLILLYCYFFVRNNNSYIYNWSLIGLSFYVSCYFFLPSVGRVFVSFYPFILLFLVSRETILNYLMLLLLLIVFIILFFSVGFDGMLTVSQENFYLEMLRQF